MYFLTTLLPHGKNFGLPFLFRYAQAKGSYNLRLLKFFFLFLIFFGGKRGVGGQESLFYKCVYIKSMLLRKYGRYTSILRSISLPYSSIILPFVSINLHLSSINLLLLSMNLPLNQDLCLQEQLKLKGDNCTLTIK